MLDLYTSTEVSEAAVASERTVVNPAAVRPKHQATHWTRRLPDPLGAALMKLRSTRTTLDAVDAASTSWERTQTTANPDSDRHVVSESDAANLVLSFSANDETQATISVSGAERRTFPRRQSECVVTLLHRDETQRLTPREIDSLLQNGRVVGRLLDISQTGLCLLLDDVVADNSELVLRISNQQLNRHVDASAHVIHSKPAGHGRFSIHCRMLRDFTLSELQDLGRPQFAGHILA